MKLDYFQVQELVELEKTTDVLDLVTPEILEQCKNVPLQTLKLAFLLAKHYPETSEIEVKETMEAHELQYTPKALSLETLTASDFIDLDSKPDWKEFFKLVLTDWKDGDFISWYEGNQHMVNFINGLKR